MQYTYTGTHESYYISFLGYIAIAIYAAVHKYTFYIAIYHAIKDSLLASIVYIYIAAMIIMIHHDVVASYMPLYINPVSKPCKLILWLKLIQIISSMLSSSVATST